mgnify:CR=1 FL=1
MRSGSTFQAYCKRVELRPPRICLVVRLNTFSGVFLGDGRDYGRVQPAGQQHAVRYVRHKLALYGGFEGIMYGRNLSLVGCGIDVRVTSMIVVFLRQGIASSRECTSGAFYPHVPGQLTCPGTGNG